MRTRGDRLMPYLRVKRNLEHDVHACLTCIRYVVVRAHFSKRCILKVCKAFPVSICHAVVFTQFGYADSKSAPCQALFLVFPFQNCKTKWPPT